MNFRTLFYSVIYLFLFSGCLGTRYLKEDQKLLYKQKLSGAKDLDKEALAALFQDEPNSRIPIIQWSPYMDIYQMGKSGYDPEKYEAKQESIREKFRPKINNEKLSEKKRLKLRSKMNKKLARLERAIEEGNWLMRIGEAPAIFDSSVSKSTVGQLERYLHTHGYFNAAVDYQAQIMEDLVTVEYKITRREPYIIDSLITSVDNVRIDSLLSANVSSSLLKKGEIYNQKNLTDERERITKLLNDNGFYDFSRQFVSFQVDSSTIQSGKNVIINTMINNKNDGSQHKVFRLDSVIFTTDADIRGVPVDRKDEVFNGIHYRFYKKRYAKKIIDWRFFLYPQELYSKQNTFESQRQLSNLDIFKFININYDTTGGSFIANVFTSPLQKYQTSTEVGVNVSQGLPGPFVNTSLKIRNIFRGLESMSLSGRFGIEGVASATEEDNVYSSIEYGGNLSVAFPQFLFPLGQRIKRSMGRYNPQTRVTAGLNYTDRPEYLRNNINTRIDYSWQVNENKKYVLTPADFSFINSSLSNDFDSLLNDLAMNGNNLRNSFLPSFVSSSSMAIVYNFNNYGNRQQNSSYLRLFVETGGNLLSLLGDDTPFGRDLEYYRWAKFSADFRLHRPLGKSSALAYRINTGVAYAYGDNETLPYERFFFAGGSNSIRAWRPRRLGPGAYRQTDQDGNITNAFEQPGNVILEASVEFRHKLFGFVNGATFIDAGNVWTLQDETARPGAQFQFENFLRQVALGAGYGVRFDFSFLLLRFDAAFKLYDPARAGGTFIWDKEFDAIDHQNVRDLIINIGIGYPF